MRFAVPTEHLVLWLLVVPVAVAVVLSRTLVRRRRAARAAFAEPHLFDRIAPGASLARVRTKLVLIVVALVCG